MSKKAKVNELRFYRLKAKKKMNSPNPEVRIRYKLEKYLKHKARYHKAKESEPQDFAVSILQHQLQNYCHISVSRKHPYE
ncbi:hypothetical protein Goshw_014626 [Gossypium schwendimanii]|uniref:Uncharacterized protein n=1 Tax=Gossypium schwendimanii TaxID=34291 RepID=A0A7J9MU64_GOSSC|nr:hypothetical protein [Gossypium schwendimanii]